VANADGQKIVTVSHDRTIKIWSCRSSTQDNAMELDWDIGFIDVSPALYPSAI